MSVIVENMQIKLR